MRGRIDDKPFVLIYVCGRIQFDHQHDASEHQVRFVIDTASFADIPLTVLKDLAKHLSLNRGEVIDPADSVTRFLEIPALHKLLTDEEDIFSVSTKVQLDLLRDFIGLNIDNRV